MKNDATTTLPRLGSRVRIPSPAPDFQMISMAWIGGRIRRRGCRSAAFWAKIGQRLCFLLPGRAARRGPLAHGITDVPMVRGGSDRDAAGRFVGVRSRFT
jgi:hypothetical protein